MLWVGTPPPIIFGHATERWRMVKEEYISVTIENIAYFLLNNAFKTSWDIFKWVLEIQCVMHMISLLIKLEAKVISNAVIQHKSKNWNI